MPTKGPMNFWFLLADECIETVKGVVIKGPKSLRVDVFEESMLANTAGSHVEIAGTDFEQSVKDCGAKHGTGSPESP